MNPTQTAIPGAKPGINVNVPQAQAPVNPALAQLPPEGMGVPNITPAQRNSINTVAQNNYGQGLINNNNQLLNNNSTQLQQYEQEIQQLLQADQPGVAPSLNLNALKAQASSQAAAQVNPLYTQYLNEYNQELAANNVAAQQEYQQNVQTTQNTEQNTLAQNLLAQQYAGQQNELTQGNINTQAANYQLNSGNAENQKIQSIAGTIGSGNLGASGYGQQQLWNAENLNNISDAQQQGQFQYQRNTNNLSTQDTFDQLAQSSLYAGQTATAEENSEQFNLNDYLRQSAANDTAYTQALQAQQQTALAAATQNYLGQDVQAQLSALNPAGSKNYAAGESAYAPQLAQAAIPEMINPTSYLSNPGGA